MTDALVPRQPDATPDAYDAATLAVLAAMEEAAEKHLDACSRRFDDFGPVRRHPLIP